MTFSTTIRSSEHSCMRILDIVLFLFDAVLVTHSIEQEVPKDYPKWVG